LTDLDDLDKARLSRVPQRYDPVLNPIQVGDKVTAREMLLDDQGEVLARSRDRCCICGRKLTDELSCSRGIGPECYRNAAHKVILGLDAAQV
jgi:hypothetical protein